MARQLHLTSGPISSQLLRLCLPLLCANVLQQLYNIANSLVVTHYIGDNAFAALGIAESVMNLFIFVITGACMGASVLLAQFFGEQNYPRLRQQLYISAVLIGGFTLVAVLLGQLFLPQLLGLINTPDNLMGDVSTYLRVILVGMMFTFTYNYLASALRAIGDTKAALYFLFLSLGYNLVAAWVLVGKLQLGILGTALATVSAQLLSTLLCLFYIQKKRPVLRVSRGDIRMDRVLIGLTCSYAAVSALQQSSLYLGKLIIQSAVNDISQAAISAFTATTRVENLTQAIGFGFCEAIAIFVAQNKGANQDRRALQGFLRGFLMTIGIGAFFCVGMGVFASPISSVFLDPSAESHALSISYLQLISFFFILAFFGNAYVGWYRGNGRMDITFWGTTIQIVARVVITYLLVKAMGLDAVALATGLGWLLIVVFQTVVFILEQKGIWPKRPASSHSDEPASSEA